VPSNLSRANPKELLKALRYSYQGLRAGLQFEASFRLEVGLFVLLAPLGFYLGETALERVLLVSVLVLIMVAELLNAAVEAIVDKTTPEFHVLAGRSKDFGSAAVFLCMLNAVFTWICLLWS